MTTTDEDDPQAGQSRRLPLGLGTALRQCLGAGYSFSHLKRDVLAGLVVGVVALPLSMALAIAAGVPPQYGLYTAIVAGAIAAALGGSPVLVTGPTAAFVVLLAPLSAKYGIAGLCVTTMLAGLMLLIMGGLRLGRLIEYIPYPVTVGFTGGIAIVIATLQLRDFFGLTIESLPEHFPQKVQAIASAMPSLQWPDVGVGAVTLVLLVIWPRISRRLPAPLVALSLVTIAVAAIHAIQPEFNPATIGSRFHYEVGGEIHGGIPQAAPLPILPWRLPGPAIGSFSLDFQTFTALLGPAFAIAMLGAIESLLSAVIADGLIGTRHDSDAELSALGVANIVTPFFGGFAATGAIARTATSIRSGGRSPFASITHAVFVLLSMLVLAPLLGYLPMASLAALLMLVAWNMLEWRHIVRVARIGPRSDAFVLLTCLGLTVVFDMVVAVMTGVVLASLLFMRRMTEITGAQILSEGHPDLDVELPPGVHLYRIAGPLFFGAAQKAMSSLDAIGGGVRAVVMDMRSVPVLDATGLVNLKSAVDRLAHSGVTVTLGGVQPQPMRVLKRAMTNGHGHLHICPSLREAIEATAAESSEN